MTAVGHKKKRVLFAHSSSAMGGGGKGHIVCYGCNN